MGMIVTKSQFFPVRQEEQALIKNPPVQNTWYTAFEEDRPKVKKISIRQANDEAAAKTLEIKATFQDGNTITGTPSCVNGAYYSLYVVPSYFGYWTTDASVAGRLMPYSFESIEHHSIKLEFRITSALGTNQTMRMLVAWHQYQPFKS